MFSLIVEPTETRLHGITLYEMIDIDMLNAFKVSDFANYECKWGSLLYNEKPTLADYAANYKKKMGLVAVDYTRGKKKLGRVNPVKSLGMTAIRRITRNTFMRNTYYDLDMDNCHPVLLRGILANSLPEGKKIELEFPYLTDYCDNRKDIIEKVMRGYNCDRKRAKAAFISLMYNGSVANWKTGDGGADELKGTDPVVESFLDKFHGEVQKIVDLFIANNPEQYKLYADAYRKDEKNKGKNNERGSFLSTIAQDYEIKIIDHLLSYIMFQTKLSCVDGHADRHIISYSYDGFMLLKERVDAHGGLSALLEDLTQRTYDFCGVEINFSAKDMNDEYHTEFVYTPTVVEAEVRETDKQREKREKEEAKQEKELKKKEVMADNNKKYTLMKKEFEKTHCKIVHHGVYVEITDHGNFIRKQRQMEEKYIHMSYKKDLLGNNVPFIYEWLKDPNIRSYENMDVFPNPTLCPANCFNLWRPFEMEFVKKWTHDQEGLDMLLNHIRIICGNDDSAYSQAMKWFAHMVQHPEHKSFMPTFISMPGAGKTSVFELLEKILGSDKCLNTSTPSTDVWGPFNGLMAGKFLVCIDDPEIVDNNFHEQIKTIILGKTLRIQRKGVDSYVEKSYVRLLGATNKENGFMREEKQGRRTLTIRSSDEKIGDSAYFKQIYALMDRKDTLKTFYEHLKNLPDVPAEYKLPEKTDYQKQLTQLTEKPVVRWLKDFTREALSHREDMRARIADGNPMNEEIPEGDHLHEYPVSELHASYIEFATTNKLEYGVSVAKFGVMLYTAGFEKMMETKKTKTCNKKVVNFTMLEKHFDTIGW
jgi:hypothetical protein